MFPALGIVECRLYTAIKQSTVGKRQTAENCTFRVTALSMMWLNSDYRNENRVRLWCCLPLSVILCAHVTINFVHVYRTACWPGVFVMSSGATLALMTSDHSIIWGGTAHNAGDSCYVSQVMTCLQSRVEMISRQIQMFVNCFASP
jgi:hypothetical protein